MLEKMTQPSVLDKYSTVEYMTRTAVFDKACVEY